MMLDGSRVNGLQQAAKIGAKWQDRQVRSRETEQQKRNKLELSNPTPANTGRNGSISAASYTSRKELERQPSYFGNLYAFPKGSGDMSPRQRQNEHLVRQKLVANNGLQVESAGGHHLVHLASMRASAHQQQQQQHHHHHHQYQRQQQHSLLPIMIDDDTTTFVGDEDDEDDATPADDDCDDPHRSVDAHHDEPTQARCDNGACNNGFQHLIDEHRPSIHNLRNFHHASSLSCVDSDAFGTYWAPSDKLSRYLLNRSSQAPNPGQIGPPAIPGKPSYVEPAQTSRTLYQHHQNHLHQHHHSNSQHQIGIDQNSNNRASAIYYQPNLYHFAYFKQNAQAAGRATPLKTRDSISAQFQTSSSQNPLLPVVTSTCSSSSTSDQYSSAQASANSSIGAQQTSNKSHKHLSGSKNTRWIAGKSGQRKALAMLGSASLQHLSAGGKVRSDRQHFHNYHNTNHHLRVPGTPTSGRKSPRRAGHSPSRSSSAGGRRSNSAKLMLKREAEQQGLTFCGKFAKLLLFMANLLLWSAGIALGAWGILTLVDDHKYNLSQLLMFEPNTRMSLFQLLSWSFITLACATILVGFCGCSAMFKNNRWILGLYIFLILAIFALDLATGLLAIIFQERLVANVRLRLANKLRSDYGVQASFTAAIDYIQTRFECCGLDGHFDYDQSLWRLQRLGGFDATVARTCCHLRNTFDDQAHINPRPVNESMCQSTDVRFHQSYRYRKGCLEDLERLIRQKIWTFTIGCGAVGGVLLLSLMFATCFCRSIPSSSSRKSSSTSETEEREKSTVAAIKQKLDAQAKRHY